MTGRNVWQVYAIKVGCPSCQNILKEKLKAFLDKEQMLLRFFPVAGRHLIPRLFTYFCLCESLVHDEDARPGQSLESPDCSARHCPRFLLKHPSDVSGLPPCFLKSFMQRKHGARVHFRMLRLEFRPHSTSWVSLQSLFFVQCFSRSEPQRSVFILLFTSAHSFLFTATFLCKCNNIWMRYKNTFSTKKGPRISSKSQLIWVAFVCLTFTVIVL